MITCVTHLDNLTIRALTKYHLSNKNGHKLQVFACSVVAMCFFILSLINAYGLWKKYYGTDSLLILCIRSSLFVVLSTIILYAAVKGAEQKLFRELKSYFESAKAEFIEYQISEDGILMNVSSKSTLYSWSSIERITSDTKLIYFTSNGKHSIISKSSFDNNELLTYEHLLSKHYYNI